MISPSQTALKILISRSLIPLRAISVMCTHILYQCQSIVLCFDSSISITWRLARNANCEAPPQSYGIRNSGVGPPICVLKVLQVTVIQVKVENNNLILFPIDSHEYLLPSRSTEFKHVPFSVILHSKVSCKMLTVQMFYKSLLS